MPGCQRYNQKVLVAWLGTVVFQVRNAIEMINRSVIGKRAKDAVPISKEQISTLKLKAQRVEEIEGLRRATVWDYICDLWTMVACSGKSSKAKQCEIYGHTLPHEGWSVGRLPKCGDCGTPITHPDDLRKAVPRQW